MTISKKSHKNHNSKMISIKLIVGKVDYFKIIDAAQNCDRSEQLLKSICLYLLSKCKVRNQDWLKFLRMALLAAYLKFIQGNKTLCLEYIMMSSLMEVAIFIPYIRLIIFLEQDQNKIKYLQSFK